MAIDFHIDNQHEDYAVSEGFLDWMNVLADQLIVQILKSHSELGSPLTELTAIECTLIGDEKMAEVHGEFMDDPTPTDVITFHHGEILIGIDEAKRNIEDSKEPIEKELAFYLCHGLLHLAGWDDETGEMRDRMLDQQEALLVDIYENSGDPPALIAEELDEDLDGVEIDLADEDFDDFDDSSDEVQEDALWDEEDDNA